MNVGNLASLAAPLVFLAGCAGSATHAVVDPHQARDDSLSCPGIDAEMAKAQHVIDEVNRDKEDWTAADVADGILWFPFNLVAKDMNYREALEAANARLGRLRGLRVEKSCAPVAAGGPAMAEVALRSAIPGERTLTGAEIERVYSGRTIDVLRSENPDRIGSDNTIVYGADGTMSGRSGSGHSDRGRWWVRDGRFCRQWERWQDGRSDCFAITSSSNRLRWVGQDGATDSIHRVRNMPYLP